MFLNSKVRATQQENMSLFGWKIELRNKLVLDVVTVLCDLYKLEGRQRSNLINDNSGNEIISYLESESKIDGEQSLFDFRDELQIAHSLGFSKLKSIAELITKYLDKNGIERKKSPQERDSLSEDQLGFIFNSIKKAEFLELDRFQREVQMHEFARNARNTEITKQEEAKQNNQKLDSKEKIDLFKEINDQIDSKLPVTSIHSNLKNENKLELGADGCIVDVRHDQIIFGFRKEGYFWSRSQFPSSPEIQKQLNQILNQIITLEIDVWNRNLNLEHSTICQIISLFPKATNLFLDGWGNLNLSELPINHKLEMLEISCSHIEGKLAEPPTTMKLTTSEHNSIISSTLEWISTVPNLEIYLRELQLNFNSISNNLSIFRTESVKDLKMLDLSAMSRLVELYIGSIDLVQTTLKLPKSLLKLKLGFVDNGTDISDQINSFSFVPNVNLEILLINDDIENWWIKKSKFLSCFLSLRISSSVASSFFQNLDMLISILESPSMLLTKLDLHSIELQTFPKSIFKLKSLHHLNLTNTNINSIPGEISNLKNLEILEAGSNNLTSKSIPKELSELINIQQLHLQSNKLSSIPDVIFSLINLSKLVLSNNQIETISEEISKLKKLTYITLSVNKIKSLPSSFYSLSNLKYLHLSDNQLKFLPSSFYLLKNLEDLILRNNELSEFGSENWNPPLLRLYVSINKIKELPRTTLLSVLDLWAKGNPLRYPPKELIDSLYSIYKFLEEAPIEIVSKKLIFWGEERVGKTTLMNSLVEGRLLSEKEHEKISKTVGFQVSKLPAQNGNFNVNMWDFAGEIWAVPFHQFFLTSNALYLIVFDLSKSWNQLLNEVSDRINVIVSRSLKEVEVLLVGTHAGSESITYPGKLMKDLFTNLRTHFNENQVSFLKVKEEFGVFLELVDLQNPLSSNFIEFRKWLYEYLLDGKFKTSPIYHQFLQKIEDPSFRQIISLKNFLETSGLNRYSQEILSLYLDLFHKQGHIAYFPKANSILLDSRWLSLDFSKLRKSTLEDPEFPKSLHLPQSTIKNLLGDTVLEAIRFFKLFNLCFEPNENNGIETKSNPKKEKVSQLIFPSLWPKSPNARDFSFLKTRNWCVYSIMTKFPNRSPPLGLFHRAIVSFLDKLDLKNLIAWEFGIIQMIDDDCAIGFHDRKEQGWLIRMYLQKERFEKALSEPNSATMFTLLKTILDCSRFEVKKCEIQFEKTFSCTCNGCREMKDGDLNWNQITSSQTFWEKLETHPGEDTNSKQSWLGAEIRCPNSGKATAQWQRLCPFVLKPVIIQPFPKSQNPIRHRGNEENQNNEMTEMHEKEESEIEEKSIQISKQQGITKLFFRKRKEPPNALETDHIETKKISVQPAKTKRDSFLCKNGCLSLIFLITFVLFCFVLLKI